MAGSVSGGCVENDVFERALQVLDTGQPLVTTYGISDELGFEVGLSCGGSIDVLIEPFAQDRSWEAVREAVESQWPAAFAIGLSPSSLLGQKLAILGDGTSVGSIDPALDQQIAAAADRLLLEGGTQVLTLPWQGQEGAVYIEAFPPPPHLLIVGATHTAIPLCWMAKGLGFRVTVIDARSMFATRERFPEADEVIRAWPDEALAQVTLDRYSFVVILTHDPKFDLPTLAHTLRSGARYIGAIGSRGTHEQRQERLRQLGFGEADLDRIRAPIGLDLGARTPEEIAVAILAEMLAVRYGHMGRPLRGGKAAIHSSS
jgi:xanthine dehydrogenase accessory factor